MNVDSARIEGIEASWHYTGEAWQARVEAIYQDPRDLTDDSRLLRRRAGKPDRSRDARVRTGACWDWTCSRAATARTSASRSDVTLDSYVLANLTAQWHATPSLALVGSGREPVQRAVRTRRHLQYAPIAACTSRAVRPSGVRVARPVARSKEPPRRQRERWATDSARSTRAPATTAAPVSATACACRRSTCGSRPTARSTRPTAHRRGARGAGPAAPRLQPR